MPSSRCAPSSSHTSTTTANQRHVYFDPSKNQCWRLPSKKAVKRALQQHASSSGGLVSTHPPPHHHEPHLHSATRNVKSILKSNRNPHRLEESRNVQVAVTLNLRLQEALAWRQDLERLRDSPTASPTLRAQQKLDEATRLMQSLKLFSDSETSSSHHNMSGGSSDEGSEVEMSHHGYAYSDVLMSGGLEKQSAKQQRRRQRRFSQGLRSSV